MKACRKVLFFLDDWMFRIANWVVCLATIVLIVSVTIQVAFRYLLNNSPRWSTELCQLMLVWVVFWGAALALRNGMHVQLDISQLAGACLPLSFASVRLCFYRGGVLLWIGFGERKYPELIGGN